MFKKTGIAALGLALMASTTYAADIKIGFVTTLTTPAAVLGNDMKDAVNLALQHLDGGEVPSGWEDVRSWAGRCRAVVLLADGWSVDREPGAESSCDSGVRVTGGRSNRVQDRGRRCPCAHVVR